MESIYQTSKQAYDAGLFNNRIEVAHEKRLRLNTKMTEFYLIVEKIEVKIEKVGAGWIATYDKDGRYNVRHFFKQVVK